MTEDKPIKKRTTVFRPTQRQENILLALSRHRLLSSKQILRIDGGSDQKILKKVLPQLVEQKYLVDPKSRKLPVNYPFVYGLANKGKSYLSTKCGVPYHLLAHHNRRPGEQVEHTLLTSDIMIAFEQACENSDHYDYISSQDILRHSPDQTRRSRTPLSWPISYEFKGVKIKDKGTVPDRIFGISPTKRSPGEALEGWFFCLEADTGSETIRPDKIGIYLDKSTTWLGKSLQYRATQKSDLFRKRFGLPFRILLVTKSDPESHVREMMDATLEACDGHLKRMFLFTTINKILETNPLELDWLQADGTKKKLVED